jgi:hypothetical protein
MSRSSVRKSGRHNHICRPLVYILGSRLNIQMYPSALEPRANHQTRAGLYGPWRENAEHCSRPIPEEPPWMGGDHTTARQVAAEPLGMSSGHAPAQCPQGRSCSDPCGESALSCQSRLDTWWPDCTPRAMRVIQRHPPPVAIRPPHHDRAVSPGAPGTCRALAGAVNWTKIM